MPENSMLATSSLKRLKLCNPLVRKQQAHCKCLSTDKPPKRPDPAIYSQLQRLSQGTDVSW